MENILGVLIFTGIVLAFIVPVVLAEIVLYFAVVTIYDTYFERI